MTPWCSLNNPRERADKADLFTSVAPAVDAEELQPEVEAKVGNLTMAMSEH